MTIDFTKDKTHQLFLAGVALKGVIGILETLVGLLFFITGAVSGLTIFLTTKELGEDPTDFLANKVVQILPYLAVHSQIFIAWYLLIHGAVKVALVIALLREKFWAYPMSLAVISLFIIYQLYQISQTGSLILIFLTIFDLAVIYLIWREYKFLKNNFLPKIQK